MQLVRTSTCDEEGTGWESRTVPLLCAALFRNNSNTTDYPQYSQDASGRCLFLAASQKTCRCKERSKPRGGHGIQTILLYAKKDSTADTHAFIGSEGFGLCPRQCTHASKCHCDGFVTPLHDACRLTTAAFHPQRPFTNGGGRRG